MSENRLPDYLGHRKQAATDACSFAEGLDKIEIIGEAATKVMDIYPEFAEDHSEIPWRSMRGMRNRIAHGCFDINLDVV